MQATQRLNHLSDLIITSLCCYILFVDSINGYLLRNDVNLLFSISQVYKIFILLLMCLRIITLNVNNIYIILVFCLTLGVPSIVSFTRFKDLGLFIDDFSVILKIVLVVTSYYYFSGIIKKKPDFTLKKINKIAYFNTYVLAINLVLGALGFGFTQYSGGAGTRGFFYAGNEISGVLIILFGFILHRLWATNKKKFFFFSVIALSLAILKSTKVAIGGSLLLIVAIPIMSGKMQFLKITRTKAIALFSLIALMPFAFYLVRIGIEHTGLLDRITYFYHKNDFLTFLLSSRNEFVIKGLHVFFNDYSFFGKLFGTGLSGFENAMEPYAPEKHTVEIDPFDLLFYFGIIGSTLVLTFYALFSFNSFKFINRLYGKPVLLINTLIIAISFTSGHIMFSGLAAIFIGMINSLIFYREAT